MQRPVNGIFGWIIVGYLSIILIFCLVWFFPKTNKGYYQDYKKYESKIDIRQKKIIDEVEKYKKMYYTNKLSKRQLIWRLESGASNLEKLYDSFKWKKGDELTKELYVLKKQIIINYAQIYKNKANSLEKEVYFDEAQEMEYLDIIVSRYNAKDKLQREKFNIAF